MRITYYLLSILIFNVVLFTAPVFESDNALSAKPLKGVHHGHNDGIAFEKKVSELYCAIDLENSGLSKKAFEYAYKGYLYLVQHQMINKTNILSICDFSQSSKNKRLYIVDLDEQRVIVNTYVAHGRRSGGEYANSFSNNPMSHKSSLGFYITEHTYVGKHGLSLKIRGLEKGFNDRALRRNIVIHGSKYVGEGFVQSNKCNGRSFGCPAIPDDVNNEVIENIKDGSCLFIYHPTKKYLASSKILNS